MRIFKILLAVCCFFIFSINPINAEQNSAQTSLSIVLPEYLKIESVTSPVLIANITNRRGDLSSNLSTTFKVITNTAETKTLYLKANIMTQDGYEEAMFEQGGIVYVAFGNISKLPKTSSLLSCKLGGNPIDSPGVVAYPVISLSGAKSQFNKSKNKYEVLVNNGITNVTVNIGANVLQSSFAKNDPKGFYQTVLSLTESDI